MIGRQVSTRWVSVLSSAAVLAWTSAAPPAGSLDEPVAGTAARAEAASSSSRIRGNLQRAIEHADADGRIHVSIVMRDQLNLETLPVDHADKELRRSAVTAALKDHAQRTQRGLLRRLTRAQRAGDCGDAIQQLWLRSAVAARLTPELITELAGRDDIAHINLPRHGEGWAPGMPERPITAKPQPIIPLATLNGTIECGVNLMGAPQVWNDLGITGNGVVVGVIDTGCCWQHPDLINQVWTNTGEVPGNNIDDDNNGYIDDIHGWSFDGNGSSSDISDSNSHGTHVSGTVAGDGTNGTVTGMAPNCEFMTLKFWNNFDGEWSVWMSMQYGVENGADVLTASLGWPHQFNPDRATWRGLCENTIAAGVVVIYAAGNEGGGDAPDDVRTPGDVPDVITIGATDCNDDIAGFSSRGPVTWQNVDPYNDWPYPPGKIKPSVAAPGVQTVSTKNDCSGYSSKSGTSMATPHVAGAVALVLEANPNLDHFGVKQILMDTAIDYGDPGMDNAYGAGRVDCFAAVEAALGAQSGPATPVDVEVVFGSLLAGGLAEIAVSDNDMLIARSAYGFSAQEPNKLEVVVGLETLHPNATLLDLVAETRLNHPGGSATTALFDWNGSQFDTIDTFAVGVNEVILLTEDVAAADYVRAGDGRIEFRLKEVVLTTFSATGFLSEIDHMGVIVD